MKTVTAFLVTLVSLSACQVRQVDNQVKNTPESPVYWINTNYLDCMKKGGLPCECYRQITLFVIDSSEVRYCDGFGFDLVCTNDKYRAFSPINEDTLFLEFEINNDILTIVNSDTIMDFPRMTFVAHDRVLSYGKTWSEYYDVLGKLNVELLAEYLKSQISKTLQGLADRD